MTSRYTNQTVWDFDGTIALSCFNEPCWEIASTLTTDIRTLAAFAVMNPTINRNDVKYILTARFDDQKHRLITEAQLEQLDLYHKILILNPRTEHTFEGFARFKTDWCNEHRPKYYVDDDPLICRLMAEGLDYTTCVTVDEWYQLNPSLPQGSPQTPFLTPSHPKVGVQE